MSIEEIAVIDFETTGLSAGTDWPTEIAVVILRDFQIVKQFDSLMNPGVPINSRIQELTGITNEMVRRAPSVSNVMRQALAMVGDRPIVAHNASFDKAFWKTEIGLLGAKVQNDFVCSMLLARRIYPRFPNHKLGTLAEFLGLEWSGIAHRAKADVLMTANLLDRMSSDIFKGHGIPSFDSRIMKIVQSSSVGDVSNQLRKIIA